MAYSASTLFSSTHACPSPCTHCEINYAHKFHVPYNKRVTITATGFSLPDTAATYCLYRMHESICPDCGDSGIKYTQVINCGQKYCLCCTNTEIQVENSGWYVLAPHVDGCFDDSVDTCPMTFHTHTDDK